MVLVGALIVSGIETVFNGLYRANDMSLQWDMDPKDSAGEPVELKAGDEFGRFKLGSTVILILPQHDEAKDLLSCSKDDVVWCGQAL